jgi:hypothetical protein
MIARVLAGGYSLEIEDPRTGATAFERHISLVTVVARAAKLIKSGYNIGIWSSASLELRRTPIVANDDRWIDTLSRRLTG